jgi:HupE/UreJ protein
MAIRSIVIRIALLTLLAIPAAGHMVSISTGELHVTGNKARFELKMPIYETELMEEPQKTLFEHFRLQSREEDGKLSNVQCREDGAEQMFVCNADYEFSAPVDVIDVECRFYQITVPNHVHILRAYRGEVAEQAIFDFTVPSVSINFIPPSWWETASQQVGAGARRAVGGLAAILFLLALVVAARTRKELIYLVGMFVTGQAVACVLIPAVAWNPAPRFVEAAAALTIAYLAVEVLLLPKAGQRWLVVGVLGLFHGLYLSLFLRVTQFSVFYVLAGSIAADVLVIGLLTALWARVRPLAKDDWAERIVAVGLLLFGLGWFFYRLR